MKGWIAACIAIWSRAEISSALDEGRRQRLAVTAARPPQPPGVVLDPVLAHPPVRLALARV